MDLSKIVLKYVKNLLNKGKMKTAAVTQNVCNYSFPSPIFITLINIVCLHYCVSAELY
jgi:hypothetical protein